MKKKKPLIIAVVCAGILVFAIIGMFGLNLLLTGFAESTNLVCVNQKFSSEQEAISALEVEERNSHDTSLDYCPPYSVKYSFEYDDNTIVLYSYCDDFDGKESSDYAVRILKHNNDGTLSFGSGFADFRLSEPNGNENYYYFTNINTTNGTKSISLLYLPKDSNKDIFVDDVKTEKNLVKIDDSEFYLCYGISKRDTFFSNLFTPISERHKIEKR